MRPMADAVSVGRLFDLSGRVALVTGGSRGLGKAMARGLAEAGADVVIASRHESELTASVAEIGQGLTRRVRHVVVDLGRRDQVARLAASAVEAMGRIDILLDDAATFPTMPLAHLSDEILDQTLQHPSLCEGCTNVVDADLSSYFESSSHCTPSLELLVEEPGRAAGTSAVKNSTWSWVGVKRAGERDAWTNSARWTTAPHPRTGSG